MDLKPASGHRIHFSKIVANVPVLLADASGRQALVISNVGAEIRLGYSGTLSSDGILIPAGQGFTDNYSVDEYWAVATSSSGTVSGFMVV